MLWVVTASRVSRAVILISLQHLLLEAIVHLLHELLAALAGFKGLVGHRRPRRVRRATMLRLQLQRVLLATGLLVSAKATMRSVTQLMLLVPRGAALLQFDLYSFVRTLERET